MACRRGWGPGLLWPLICTPLAVELGLPDPLLPGLFLVVDDSCSTDPWGPGGGGLIWMVAVGQRTVL